MGFEKILRELSGLLVLLTEGWQPFPICTRIAINSADDFANHNYCISSVLMTLTTKGLQRAVRSWPYYLLLSCRACWRAFCRPSSITFFHPQQLAMLMISEDATIRIWDLETSLSDAMAILFSEVKEIQRGYHKVMMPCDMLEWRLRCKAYGHVYIQRDGLGGLNVLVSLQVGVCWVQRLQAVSVRAAAMFFATCENNSPTTSGTMWHHSGDFHADLSQAGFAMISHQTTQSHACGGHWPNPMLIWLCGLVTRCNLIGVACQQKV